MKLVIFGASGLTGQELVKQAIEQDHVVTSFLRSSSVLPIEHHNLHMVRGELNEAAHVREVVKGHDAVLCALGTSRLLSPDFGLTQGLKSIIAAMVRIKVRRLVYLSALGAGDSREEASLFFRSLVIPFALRHPYAYHDEDEKTLRVSSLEWVVVRPSVLTNGPKTERYLAARHLKDREPFGLISRADVAHFMLSQPESDQHLRQGVNVRS